MGQGEAGDEKRYEADPGGAVMQVELQRARHERADEHWIVRPVQESEITPRLAHHAEGDGARREGGDGLERQHFSPA